MAKKRGVAVVALYGALAAGLLWAAALQGTDAHHHVQRSSAVSTPGTAAGSLGSDGGVPIESLPGGSESAAGAAEPGAPVTPEDPAGTTHLSNGDHLGNGEPIRLMFAGDMYFQDRLHQRLKADPSTAIGPFASVLRQADVAVGNLETAITTRGTPAAKQFTFRTNPQALDALAAAGFDAVSMANNHGMDFGTEGLRDTLAARSAAPQGFVIGVGHDLDDALRAYTTTVRGQRIAVIAATQVLDDGLSPPWHATADRPGLASAKDPEPLLAAVRAARSTADTVVVYLHWGIERNECPSKAQGQLAHQLADAGADVIVGGHAHRLQGAGMLGSSFVAYGLGNFAFYAGSAESARTGVVEVTVTGRRVDGYRFIPGVIEDHVPRPLTGAAANEAVARWDQLRACTGLTP